METLLFYIQVLHISKIYISNFDFNLFLLMSTRFFYNVSRYKICIIYVAQMIIYKLYFCHLRRFFIMMLYISVLLTIFNKKRNLIYIKKFFLVNFFLKFELVSLWRYFYILFIKPLNIMHITMHVLFVPDSNDTQF